MLSSLPDHPNIKDRESEIIGLYDVNSSVTALNLQTEIYKLKP
jgi:hypothetical protein